MNTLKCPVKAYHHRVIKVELRPSRVEPPHRLVVQQPLLVEQQPLVRLPRSRAVELLHLLELLPQEQVKLQLQEVPRRRELPLQHPKQQEVQDLLLQVVQDLLHQGRLAALLLLVAKLDHQNPKAKAVQANAFVFATLNVKAKAAAVAVQAVEVVKLNTAKRAPALPQIPLLRLLLLPQVPVLHRPQVPVLRLPQIHLPLRRLLTVEVEKVKDIKKDTAKAKAKVVKVHMVNLPKEFTVLPEIQVLAAAAVQAVVQAARVAVQVVRVAVQAVVPAAAAAAAVLVVK